MCLQQAYITECWKHGTGLLVSRLAWCLADRSVVKACVEETSEQGHILSERVKVSARQTNLIQYGDEEIDLSAVEQLVEKSQTRAIADAISTLKSWLGQQRHQGKTLAQLLQELEAEMDSKACSSC